jgi:signal transduction histidine kinase
VVLGVGAIESLSNIAQVPGGVVTTTAAIVAPPVIAGLFVLRQRRPLHLVGAITLVACALILLGDPVVLSPLAIAVTLAAVQSPGRRLWVGVFTASVGMALAAVVARSLGSGQVSAALVLVFAALIGAKIGGRSRYTSALVDRADRIARERDQQILLAAAGERAHIARELHDVIAHSLTVMVRLADESTLAGTDTSISTAAAAGVLPGSCAMFDRAVPIVK